MMLQLHNMKGEVMGTMEVPDAMFGVAVQPALVHEAVVAQRANARMVIASTKDRSEVRGGGRKPWRQKGTGRARHGSRRSPLWVGGGITFGPTTLRNFALKMNRKARRKALYMALSDKAANQSIVVVDAWDVAQGKTRALVNGLHALPTKGKRTLLVVEPSDTVVRMAASNIAFTQTIAPNSINTVDVLKANTLVFSKASMDACVSHFLKQ